MLPKRNSASPRILFVTRNFPPLTGGMERLALHAFGELEKTYRCSLVGPRGSTAFVNSNLPGAECTLNPLPRFLLEAWIKARRLLKSASPDLLIAGSGLTAPIAVALAKQAKAPAITLLHGLDIVAANAVYQAAFIPAIRRSDVVIANSRNTATLAEKAGVDCQQIRVLHPGVDIGGTQSAPNSFRRMYGLDDRKVLLSVGRLIPRKGLSEFITHALPRIVARIPSTRLVIIGGEATQALKRGRGALAGIKNAASSARMDDHIVYLGNVDEKTLHCAYTEADVFVLPVLDLPGDVEGFGMVAVEAAAHGLPTVGFAAGGVPDAIGNGRSGFLLPAGDYGALASAIAGLLTDKDATGITAVSCRQHAEKFSWAHYGEGLRAIVHQALQRPLLR